MEEKRRRSLANSKAMVVILLVAFLVGRLSNGCTLVLSNTASSSVEVIRESRNANDGGDAILQRMHARPEHHRFLGGTDQGIEGEDAGGKSCDEILDGFDRRFDEMRAARQNEMAKMDLGHVREMDWWDVFEPEAACFTDERFGSKTRTGRYGAVGDGPKFLCGIDHIAEKAARFANKGQGEGCLVYSVGSNNDVSFERAVYDYMPGCEIHTFDPTLKTAFVGDQYATFHDWGVGTDGESTNAGSMRKGVEEWTSKGLETIMRELGHTHRTIDILKIDCQGCEYAAMPPLFDAIAAGKVGIGQLQIEMHIRKNIADLPAVHAFFAAADRAKLRIFHKERNHWGCSGYRCVEYAFVSEAFLREANAAAVCPSGYLPSATATVVPEMAVRTKPDLVDETEPPAEKAQPPESVIGTKPEPVVKTRPLMETAETMSKVNNSQGGWQKSKEAKKLGGCSFPTPAQREALANRTHDLLHSKRPDHEYYSDILAEIHAGCGELCTRDDDRRVPLEEVAERDLPFATYFSYRVVAKVSCCDLFAHPLLDAPAARWPPPRWDDLPAPMKEEFLGFHNESDVAFKRGHHEERFSGGQAATPVFTKESIGKMKRYAREGRAFGNYGGKGTAKLTAYAKKYCQGKHMAVVGSKSPWVESILLAAGARRVTTIEYGAIESRHPDVTTLTNGEFNRRFLDGTLEPFDAYVSYSSMEHAGLGRYGDSLNPWGDVVMAAKMRCALKPGGVGIIGVPTLKDGGEGLVFNAHRQYGRRRWPIFLTNYKPLPQLEVEGLKYYHQDIVAAEAV